MTVAARPLPALPGPYSPKLAADRILAIAASQIGYREGRSSGGSWNNDNVYGVWYGFPNVSWCAQFVSWCAQQAGYLDKIIPKHQYTPSGYAWFKKQGRVAESPRRGDIVYVWNSGPRRISHVGFVERALSSTRIQTIEGNTNLSGDRQGNGVYRLQRTVTSRLFFARPDYGKVVLARPPSASAAASGGGEAGATAAPPRVTALSTKALQYAATHASMSGSWHAQRVATLSTLKVLGFIETVYPAEAVAWDKHFRTAWQRWQQSLGYRGKDADGVPGEDSVERLRRRAGYKRLP